MVSLCLILLDFSWYMGTSLVGWWLRSIKWAILHPISAAGFVCRCRCLRGGGAKGVGYVCPPNLEAPRKLNEKSLISVIVPTFNEGGSGLVQTIARAQQDSNVQIIVVDAGSTDGTRELAEKQGVTVFVVPAGSRSACLNFGATQSRGEILLFLHADTLLPEGWGMAVRQSLSSKYTLAGAFGYSVVERLAYVSMVEWGTNLRSRWFQWPYGDQALHLTKAVFDSFGGFPRQKFMEDFELVRRLRTCGYIRTLNSSIQTSGRRWQKLGVWRAVIRNQLVITAYLSGMSSDHIRWWYYNKEEQPQEHASAVTPKRKKGPCVCCSRDNSKPSGLSASHVAAASPPDNAGGAGGAGAAGVGAADDGGDGAELKGEVEADGEGDEAEEEEVVREGEEEEDMYVEDELSARVRLAREASALQFPDHLLYDHDHEHEHNHRHPFDQQEDEKEAPRRAGAAQQRHPLPPHRFGRVVHDVEDDQQERKQSARHSNPPWRPVAHDWDEDDEKDDVDNDLGEAERAKEESKKAR